MERPNKMTSGNMKIMAKNIKKTEWNINLAAFRGTGVQERSNVIPNHSTKNWLVTSSNHHLMRKDLTVALYGIKIACFCIFHYWWKRQALPTLLTNTKANWLHDTRNTLYTSWDNQMTAENMTYPVSGIELKNDSLTNPAEIKR